MPRAKPPPLPTETMTAAEFKVARERLGLPAAWVARQLGTFERTLSRWETGAHPVRPDAQKLLGDVEKETLTIITRLAARTKPGAVLITYRYDANVKVVSKYGWDYPASWHRAVIGRVAMDMLDGDCRIVYDD